MINVETLAASLLLSFGDFLICFETMIWSVQDFLNLFLNGDFLNLFCCVGFSIVSFLSVNFLNGDSLNLVLNVDFLSLF